MVPRQHLACTDGQEQVRITSPQLLPEVIKPIVECRTLANLDRAGTQTPRPDAFPQEDRSGEWVAQCSREREGLFCQKTLSEAPAVRDPECCFVPHTYRDTR